MHIKDEIINDFMTNGSDAFKIIYDKNGTLVLEHEKHPDYLLKISDKDYKSSHLQSDILSSIADEHNNISRIHHTQEYSKDGSVKTLELLDKLNGIAKSEYSPSEIENIIKSTKKLHGSLKEISEKYITSLPPLSVIFTGIINSTTSTALKAIADKIKNDKGFGEFLNAPDRCITIADMVYENILIDNGTVNFIDLDPLILGPENLQIAILITSNLLMENSQFDNLSIALIEHYYNVWGIAKISRADIIALSVFPLLILSMRQVDIDNLPKNSDSMYYKLKTILLFIADELKKN